MLYKKRLLCIVYEPGNFQVWLKLVRHGQETGEFDVILWSPYCLPDSERYQAEAMAAGTIYIEEATRTGSLADIHSRLSGWLSAKPPHLSRDLQAKLDGGVMTQHPNRAAEQIELLVSELTKDDQHAIFCAVDRVRRRISFCEDWLVRLGIDAVVLPEDNAERDSYAWIESAKRRGIRSIISSYGAVSAQEAVNAYKHSPMHALSESNAALVRRHWPQWLAEGDDFTIARLPLYELIAREFTGTSMFNPWLVNTGNVDAIALESQSMLDSYRALGFPVGRLKPIGHPLQDTLAASESDRVLKRAALVSQYRLDPRYPIAIVAMPPNQTATRPCQYQGYGDVVEAFAKLPADVAAANVIVSPHPNMSEDGLEMIRSTGAILAEKPLVELLPVADFYVACVSSTIKWALGCGVPIINYDCYGYQYSDYLNLPQVINVNEDRAFRAALLRLGNSSLRQQLIDLARTQSEYWGKYDGKALERLINLCFERERT